MTRSSIRMAVVTAKLDVIRRMLAGISTLPLSSESEFLADPRMVAAGESFLRRALEALFDLGRHILAKGFGIPTSDYKAIVRSLLQQGVVEVVLANRMTDMAGYRNRMVHFYDEVTAEELYEILTEHLGDVEAAVAAIQVWMAENPEMVDEAWDG
ncbi:MAG: DUF86 domain-containing protein [bacterium]|nr:DUF86 domain-containing protein [bacterium]